jgi:Tfp pilus assembly protein PilZ
MKIAALARQARESLGKGLEALQAGDAPERMLAVAQPLAQAMGTLAEMEAAPPALARKASESVLAALRQALGLLQLPQNAQLPSAEAGMGSVAEALGLVKQIFESTEGMSAMGGKTQLGSTQLAGAPAAAPVPPPAKPPGATAAKPPGATAAKPPVATAQDVQSELEGPLRAIEAALGAHSATNFYKGLAAGDVVASGGLFIATYQVPEVGEPLLLKITMPGGYAFEAKGVVAWRRDVQVSSTSPGETPGFGAQFSEISDEGRGLIQRYVRNREPLFHDDA